MDGMAMLERSIWMEYISTFLDMIVVDAGLVAKRKNMVW